METILEHAAERNGGVSKAVLKRVKLRVCCMMSDNVIMLVHRLMVLNMADHLRVNSAIAGLPDATQVSGCTNGGRLLHGGAATIRYFPGEIKKRSSLHPGGALPPSTVMISEIASAVSRASSVTFVVVVVVVIVTITVIVIIIIIVIIATIIVIIIIIVIIPG